METKYTFIETEGCTAFGFSVNSKELEDIEETEHAEILEYLLAKVREGIADNTILFRDVVKLFQPDDWHYSKDRCEQCGDSISTTIWKI